MFPLDFVGTVINLCTVAMDTMASGSTRVLRRASVHPVRLLGTSLCPTRERSSISLELRFGMLAPEQAMPCYGSLPCQHKTKYLQVLGTKNEENNSALTGVPLAR